MSKFRINWRNVRKGDIVSFPYGKGSERRTRVALIMEVGVKKDKIDGTESRLLHALQFKVGDQTKIHDLALQTIIKKLGTPIKVGQDENASYYKMIIQDSQLAYNMVKDLIKNEDIYRTYSHKKLKGVPVFFESFNELKGIM